MMANERSGVARVVRVLAVPILLGWLLLTIATNVFVPSLEKVGEDRLDGVAKNFARVVLGEFSVSMAPAPSGGTSVSLEITDYSRFRSTMYLIPVGPVEAPAYKALKDVSEHVRSHL